MNNSSNLEVIEIVENPPGTGGGTVTLSNGKITYQPDQIGQFSFKYKASSLTYTVSDGVVADAIVSRSMSKRYQKLDRSDSKCSK